MDARPGMDRMVDWQSTFQSTQVTQGDPAYLLADKLVHYVLHITHVTTPLMSLNARCEPKCP